MQSRSPQETSGSEGTMSARLREDYVATETASWADAIRQKDFAAIADWFILYFFSTGVIALLLIGIAAGFDDGLSAALRIVSLSLLMASACTVSGWLLGLLFGIPRTLA